MFSVLRLAWPHVLMALHTIEHNTWLPDQLCCQLGSNHITKVFIHKNKNISLINNNNVNQKWITVTVWLCLVRPCTGYWVCKKFYWHFFVETC